MRHAHREDAGATRSRPRSGTRRPCRGLAAVAAAAVLLSACGSARPQTRRYFSLAPQAPESSSASTRPRLRVAELDTAEAYDQFGMMFRVSPVEIRSYRYVQWTSKPGDMVAEVLRRYLGTSGLFSMVAIDEPSDLELGGRVDVIEQVVEDGRWLGRLEIVLSLRRVRDGRVVWQQRIDGVEEAESRDVAEVVAAMSRVLSAGLRDALPSLASAAVDAAVGPPAGTVSAPER